MLVLHVGMLNIPICIFVYRRPIGGLRFQLGCLIFWLVPLGVLVFQEWRLRYWRIIFRIRPMIYAALPKKPQYRVCMGAFIGDLAFGLAAFVHIVMLTLAVYSSHHDEI